MTKIEIAWLAGLFEGEGSFYINRIKKYGKVYEYPCAGIRMTDEDVVRRAHKLFGAGNIRTTRPKNPKWKQNWTWTVNGKELTERLYTMLLPYLGLRRASVGKQILGI